jgi:hypothetical protein
MLTVVISRVVHNGLVQHLREVIQGMLRFSKVRQLPTNKNHEEVKALENLVRGLVNGGHGDETKGGGDVGDLSDDLLGNSRVKTGGRLVQVENVFGWAGMRRRFRLGIVFKGSPGKRQPTQKKKKHSEKLRTGLWKQLNRDVQTLALSGGNTTDNIVTDEVVGDLVEAHEKHHVLNALLLFRGGKESAKTHLGGKEKGLADGKLRMMEKTRGGLEF